MLHCPESGHGYGVNFALIYRGKYAKAEVVGILLRLVVHYRVSCSCSRSLFCSVREDLPRVVGEGGRQILSLRSVVNLDLKISVQGVDCGY